MEVNLVTNEDLKKMAREIVEAISLQLRGFGVSSLQTLPYSNKEACKYLKVCSKTLQNYRDNGLIEFSQIGRKITYKKADLDDFLAKYKKGLFNKKIINR